MGHAIRVAGHFGEFLQGRLGPSGPVALITLPCPVLQVWAQVAPSDRLRLHAQQQVLTRDTVAQLLRVLGVPANLRIKLRVAMPVGGGAGASTAALVAVARQVAPEVPPHELALLCCTLEGATDPLMLAAPERHLWASRQGVRFAELPALPRFEVLGGFFGPAERTAPQDMNFPDIADLLPLWHQAACRGDRAGLAQLASLSATRCATLRGPDHDPTPGLAQRLGALGWARAHTGSARALLFAPGTVPKDGLATLRTAGLHRCLHYSTQARS